MSLMAWCDGQCNQCCDNIINLEKLVHDFHVVLSYILRIKTYFREDLSSHIKFHLGRPSAFF